mmetsp:Transcript_109493/g.327351  ORF Transcript_109493/g.327351 Transcript_109493/m.327351 type:complete len:551 (-) Transcript_109493:46-1698(-)
MLRGCTETAEAQPELLAREQAVSVGIQGSEGLVRAPLLARVDLRGDEAGDKLLELGPLADGQEAVDVSLVQHVEVAAGYQVLVDKPPVLQCRQCSRPSVLHLVEHLPTNALGLLRSLPHQRPIWLSHDSLGEVLDAAGDEGQAARKEEKKHAANRPDVATLAEVALPDLGCHEGRGSRDDATTVRGVGEHLGEAEVHHDDVHVADARLPRRREHDILRLQVLVDDGLGVAVGNSRQRVLHDLRDPVLVGRRVHGLQRLHVRRQVATAARLHDEVEVLVVLKVLKDPQHMRVIELLQHRELLPHLSLRRLGFPRLCLRDYLADPHALLILAVALRLVCHHVHGAERAFPKLLPHLVHVAKSLEVLLDKLLPPSLVSLLRRVAVPWHLRLDLLLRTEEAQKTEQQCLKILATNALRTPHVPAVLLEHLPHLHLDWDLHLEVLQPLGERLLEVLEAHLAPGGQPPGLEGPLRAGPKLVLAVHQLCQPLLSPLGDHQARGAGRGTRRPGAHGGPGLHPRQTAGRGRIRARRPTGPHPPPEPELLWCPVGLPRPA